MSELRVPVQPLASGRLALDREASHYVARVRRVAEGGRFVAFDPESRTEADALVASIAGRGEVVLEVGPLRGATLLPEREATVIQCVGKGDKLDAVVRDATELGATAVLPAISSRCVAGRGSEARLLRWQRIGVEAARQCGRGDVPRIAAPAPLGEVLRSVRAELRVVLSPVAEASLGDRLVALEPRVSVAFVVGPEGGLAEAEIAEAVEAGFQPARIGPFVLRTETVAAAVLGAVTLLPRAPRRAASVLP